MFQGEHSAILLTFIKLPFVIKIFVLSIFEWLSYTDFTVVMSSYSELKKNDLTLEIQLLLIPTHYRQISSYCRLFYSDQSLPPLPHPVSSESYLLLTSTSVPGTPVSGLTMNHLVKEHTIYLFV